eukprot:COSAG01_NODE_22620_length_848_cov_0.951936_1_plen_56_part_10
MPGPVAVLDSSPSSSWSSMNSNRRNVYRQRPAFEIKFRLELQYELVLHVCHVSCVL